MGQNVGPFEIFFGYCCICQPLFLGAIYVGFYTALNLAVQNFHITIGENFMVDWNTPLISDIYVRDKKEGCNGDDSAIHMPWFGYNHMCISGKEGFAYRGFTCSRGGLEYKQVGSGKQRKKVRTSYQDFPGFPMIQMSEFNDRRFCLQELRNQSTGIPVTFLNLKLAEGGKCYGEDRTAKKDVKCGKFCVPNGYKCPITEIAHYDNYNMMQLGNWDGFVSLDDTDPKDQNATHNFLAFKSDLDNDLPITSIKLAVSRPCFDSQIPSSLKTNDNSIYQLQDYEFTLDRYDKKIKIHDDYANASRKFQTTERLNEQLDDRMNNCPVSQISKKSVYFEDTYNEVKFTITLDDILDGNDVDEVIEEKTQFFEKQALKATKNVIPSMWYRPALYFDLKCELNSKISRQEAMNRLQTGLDEILNSVRAEAQSGTGWGTFRIFLFFFGFPCFCIFNTEMGDFRIIFYVIFFTISILTQLLNLSYTRGITAGMNKVLVYIKGLSEVNSCISPEHQMTSTKLEEIFVKEVQPHINAPNVINWIYLLGTIAPIAVAGVIMVLYSHAGIDFGNFCQPMAKNYKDFKKLTLKYN